MPIGHEAGSFRFRFKILKIVPVSHILKFDLNFEGNSHFWNIRIDHVMLKFIAATEMRIQ